MEKLLKFFILTTFYMLTISECKALYIENTQQYFPEKITAMDYIIKANQKLKDRQTKNGENISQIDIVMTYEDKVTPGKINAATRLKAKLWDGGIIPYSFHRSIARLEYAKMVIKDAMYEWESNTCIRFVERSNEIDYVEFAVNLGCNADVGRRGGRQIISLGDGCLHKSVIIHEIGHVIGFWHEQNRYDRDDYVTIYTDNIMDQYKEAFTKFNQYRINSRGVRYDYHSIMHYGMKAFSKNGQPTILPKDKNVVSLGNDRLSPLDVKQTNLLYECDTKYLNQGWTSWSRWTLCDKSCAGGIQERKRVCRSLSDGVAQCEGANLEKRVCNIQACPAWPKFPMDFSFEHLRVDRDHQSECVLIYERADYREWNSYSFCNRGKRNIQMRWSDHGPIAGHKCTQIFEPRESQNNRWYDNYLCLPWSAPYNFTWSYEGKKEGLACIQWYAKEGRDGWDNNFLCAEGHESTMNKPAIDGGWSAWSNWTLCNKECGGGKQRRLRVCNSPKPQFSGRSSPGAVYEDRDCNINLCPNCGGILNGSKGEFHSPNYPQNYPDNTNCTWLIVGNKAKKIKLTITSFDFEKTFGTCIFDYLLIRDGSFTGSELGKFCGNELPQPILSHTNSLYINMVTDGEDNRAGFRGSWELQEAEPEGCGGIIKGTKGKLSSPNFPKPYPAEITCVWKIEAPKDYYIRMVFARLDLEKHSNCKYGSVEMKDGWDYTSPRLGRYCGLNPVKGSIKTISNKASIKFISDHSTERTGFKLFWRAYKKYS